MKKTREIPVLFYTHGRYRSIWQIFSAPWDFQNSKSWFEPGCFGYSILKPVEMLPGRGQSVLRFRSKACGDPAMISRPVDRDKLLRLAVNKQLDMAPVAGIMRADKRKK